jgi:hypothetical protein
VKPLRKPTLRKELGPDGLPEVNRAIQEMQTSDLNSQVFALLADLADGKKTASQAIEDNIVFTVPDPVKVINDRRCARAACTRPLDLSRQAQFVKLPSGDFLAYHVGCVRSR